MMDQLFVISPWIGYGLSLVIVLIAAQVGYLIGQSWRREHPSESRSDLLTLEGAGLGLLALMIGFTFSMAMTRYDNRLVGLLKEANAIGTTALRADMLPQPYSSQIKNLLHDYIQIRLDLARARPSGAALEQAVRSSNALQQEIWRRAVAVATPQPNSIQVGLFVQSVNEMIDLQELRLAAGRNRIPDIVFLLLYGVAATAVGLSGYVSGLAEGNGRIAVAILAALIAVVIGLISDFDRSNSGFVTISQQSMQSLKDSMSR